MTARDEIIKLIKNKNNRNVAIIMHDSPDGDCIGSAVALEEALKYNNKKVDIILHNKVSEKFSSIIGENRVNKYIFPYEDKYYDLIFILDVCDFHRTYYEILKKGKKKIIIDHHLNDYIPKVDCYLNNLDSSTGMTLYNIIKSICPITKTIATALYLTLRSDTEDFKNSSTNSKTLMIASELLQYGADIDIINDIYEYKTYSYILLLNRTLSNLKIDFENKIAYLIIQQYDIKECGSNMKEAGSIIDLIKSIKDIEMAFIFIESNDQIVVKARSKNVDIVDIIKNFGGGGHKCSAGCIINSDDIYRTKDKVINYAINSIS